MTQKNRLDTELQKRGLATTRSQAENLIKLGMVTVNNKAVIKPGFFVSSDAPINVTKEAFVSRAGLKLASVANIFNLSLNAININNNIKITKNHRRKVFQLPPLSYKLFL